MIKGLEVFQSHFADFLDNYVLIGGAACYLVMNEAGLPFRATKDLDIVLCAEALDKDFAKAFWEFVELGKYQNRSRGDQKQFYRFDKPEDKEVFPYMLELFSRDPNIELSPGQEITPLPIDEEVSSLSAILLDEIYYNWLKTGMKVIDGITVVGEELLIPLKMRAWNDLNKRRAENSSSVDSKTVNKHRKDVFILTQLLSENPVEIPSEIKSDVEEFLANCPEFKLKDIGIKEVTYQSAVEILKAIYLT